MKHSLSITLLLLALFLLTQIVGISTIAHYIGLTTDSEGNKRIVHADTILGEQPQIENKSYSAIPIIITVLLGTALLLLLIKLRLGKVWKLWFFLAVWITLTITLEVFIAQAMAIALALVLALLKIYRPNVFIHNLTEIFIYTGIAIIILPFLNLLSASILLIIISLYDMIAVWKSRHMIALATFQTESNLFAGLYIPYGKGEKRRKATNSAGIAKGAVPEEKAGKKASGSAASNAILGGGDLAFPLVFSAAVLEHLVLLGAAVTAAFTHALLITAGAAIALFLLFLRGQKGKFYPAMPFISLGCFAGLAAIYLIRMI
ncbi:TPA: hypothetical protein HA270_05075 [Candidatus Woesearchaeota archaeon]|nr:hypothetical protein [Candidatus Woesearchaeota archaeon]